MPEEPARTGEAVRFELADPGGRLAAVRLIAEIEMAPPLDFARRDGLWSLSVRRPDVERMEYLLQIEDRRGNRRTILDPANPRRVAGAFGDKSVFEFAEYRPPGWLDIDPVAAREDAVQVSAPGSAAPLQAIVWTPASLRPGEPAPLLVVHDGPEYERLGGFTRYLGSAMASGRLPPVRAALLEAADRDTRYSADPDYAHLLCRDLLPALQQQAPAIARIGLGVSLGALALLHAHHHHPGTFDGLFLQSGSFFTAALDPQESGFSGFAAVTGFVAEFTRTATSNDAVPTVLTCGTVEENRANNEAMAATLHRAGYGARLALVRDGHNYTAWRDALDPHLSLLITEIARSHAA